MKSPAGKEEVPEPMDATIMAYCGAQCKFFVQCNMTDRPGQYSARSPEY
jgi:hypothetical protein